MMLMMANPAAHICFCQDSGTIHLFWRELTHVTRIIQSSIRLVSLKMPPERRKGGLTNPKCLDQARSDVGPKADSDEREEGEGSGNTRDHRPDGGGIGIFGVVCPAHIDDLSGSKEDEDFRGQIWTRKIRYLTTVGFNAARDWGFDGSFDLMPGGQPRAERYF